MACVSPAEDDPATDECRVWNENITTRSYPRPMTSESVTCEVGTLNEEETACIVETCTSDMNLWCVNDKEVLWPEGKDFPPEFGDPEEGKCPAGPDTTPCPTCDKAIPEGFIAVEWGTSSGPTTRSSDSLRGTLPYGVMVQIANNGYYKIPRKGYVLDRIIEIEWNETQLQGEVTIWDNGKWWPTPKCEANFTGDCEVRMMGRVCNILDKDRTKCFSTTPQVYIDGVLQTSFMNEGPENLLYNYSVCAITPSPAFTSYVDDLLVFDYTEGMVSNKTGRFALKAGIFEWSEETVNFNVVPDEVRKFATWVGHDLSRPIVGKDDNGNPTLRYPEVPGRYPFSEDWNK